MQHGLDTEAEARAAYAFHIDQDVTETGLWRHPKIKGSHASPDGLIGADGVVELKCPQPAAHLDLLLGAATPQRHVMQGTWHMAVTGRQWCDLVGYQPTLPAAMQLVVPRIDRDVLAIGRLEAEVTAFLAELESKVLQLSAQYLPERTYGAVQRLKDMAARPSAV